jgi:hypothetical protein
MPGIELAVVLALATVAPSPVSSEPAEQICVGGARYWRGSAEDIRHIAATPVPARYRALFYQGGCGSGLVHESLIDWHLAFGSEQSTAGALAFLEQAYMGGAPKLPDFPGALSSAWRAAQRDLRAAESLLSGPGPGHDEARRRLDVLPSVVRLKSLIQAHRRLVFLAAQSMRAAEFYRSPSLLVKARAYFTAAEANRTMLYGEASLTAGGPGGSTYHYIGLEERLPGELNDIEWRLAILAARLSGNPSDVDAAARIGDRNFTPVLRLAAEKSDRQGDFCDNGVGDDLDPIRAVCREENNFLRRFTSFWRNQAQVDALMAADPEHFVVRPIGPSSHLSGSSYVRGKATEGSDEQPGIESFEFATTILERGRLESRINGWAYGGTDDDLVALYLARAELYVRLATTARARGLHAGDAADLLLGALSDLRRAQRHAPPFDTPGRFRQIATLYLQLAPRLEALRREESDGRSGDDPGHAREAAYFARVLADLDGIAIGETSPSHEDGPPPPVR